MLDDNRIDSLIQPIINRQETINTYVLTKIGEMLREIGEVSPSDINRLKIMAELGVDVKDINNELARISNLQVRDIKSTIKIVAEETHLDAKPLYDYRHKTFTPFERDNKMQSLARAIGNTTAQSYENLSNSKATGLLIRDPKNPSALKFQTIDRAYKSVIDEAIQASKSGVVDYRTAIRRTIRQLSESGVRRVYWDSGYTQRLDTAVRRNILMGIRDITQAVEDENGKRIDADGKELSAHFNCALDHEPFQGHQFTNEEYDKLQSNEDFEDLQGNHFIGVDRVIGEYNCRHIARSIIVGVTEPMYTQEELDEMIRDNHEGYTLPSGKKITLYECTQIQRRLETKIRYAKDEQMLLAKSGDIEGAKTARAKVVRLNAEYKRFSSSCGLAVQKDRIAVSGYKAKVE